MSFNSLTGELIFLEHVFSLCGSALMTDPTAIAEMCIRGRGHKQDATCSPECRCLTLSLSLSSIDGIIFILALCGCCPGRSVLSFSPGTPFAFAVSFLFLFVLRRIYVTQNHRGALSTGDAYP